MVNLPVLLRVLLFSPYTLIDHSTGSGRPRGSHGQRGSGGSGGPGGHQSCIQLYWTGRDILLFDFWLALFYIWRISATSLMVVLVYQFLRSNWTNSGGRCFLTCKAAISGSWVGVERAFERRRQKKTKSSILPVLCKIPRPDEMFQKYWRNLIWGQ